MSVIGGRTPPDLVVNDEDAPLAAALVADLGVGDVTDVVRLGGMTNRNFRVSTVGAEFHVRLPGAGTDAYIDRAAEGRNARRAAELGLNCEVLRLDADGTMVCAWVDGEVLDPSYLAASGDRLEQAARLLWRLHTGAGRFVGRFDPQDVARRHRTALPTVPSGVDDLVERVAGFDLATALAPCHNDPWSMNFVWGATGVVLVDWEYSAMNDPAWDLAHLSVESGLDATDHDRLLEGYCGGDPPAGLRRRVDLLRGVTDVVWGLWALVQHADANDATDFESYATDRFERAPTWW